MASAAVTIVKACVAEKRTGSDAPLVIVPSEVPLLLRMPNLGRACADGFWSTRKAGLTDDDREKPATRADATRVAHTCRTAMVASPRSNAVSGRCENEMVELTERWPRPDRLVPTVGRTDVAVYMRRCATQNIVSPRGIASVSSPRVSELFQSTSTGPCGCAVSVLRGRITV